MNRFQGLSALLALVLIGGLWPVAHAANDRGSAGIGDSYFPLDGNGGIDVLHYDVRDGYNFATGRLWGKTKIRLRATENLARFNLDFLLPVRKVKVNGVSARFTRSRGHELRITVPERLEAGDPARVVVTYAGNPGRASYLGEHNWLADDSEVVTMNEPHMAAWWFPANDHPRDKASFDIRITVPRKMKVIANGRKISRKVKGRSATTHWRASEPMTSFLAFFAAGKFQVKQGTQAGRHYVVAVSKRLPRETRRANMALMLKSPAITNWLATQVGAYPFSSTGGVVTSLRPGFALENQTRPTYPGSPYLGESLVVHELAHQWFGDSVALDRWRDIWLAEGFATFMEQRWSETHGGQSADEWLHAAYGGIAADADFWKLSLDNPGPDRLFDQAVYLRGAMALQALRNRVGESDFWAILRTWVSARKGGTGSVTQFRALAESVSGVDLDGLFEAWLHDRSKPANTAANGL
ncbi:M1 family metallopeptidase [Nocardioides sp.]|uniref:M1 family metallopeptidase n=1 Tax=Nocardioides sp. TaxID=35761 RepID=UPI003568FB7E